MTRNGAWRRNRRASSGLHARAWPNVLALLRVQRVEALLEPAGVRTLGAGQGLEPLGDLGEALFARGLRERRVHLRVLVRLAGDRRLEVLRACRRSARRSPDHRRASGSRGDRARGRSRPRRCRGTGPRGPGDPRRRRPWRNRGNDGSPATRRRTLP